MNKKIKIAIYVALSVFIIAGGSVWFGYRKSQTIMQDVQSRLGYGKPDADAASQIVFLGDSITLFEDWNVLFGVSNVANFGVAGNTTDDVLARLDSAISAKPQKLFLMIGINDLLKGKDAEYVMSNYVAILDRIRIASPNTKIYVQSLLPVNLDIWKTQTLNEQEISAVNERLKVLSGEKGVTFINLYPSFAGADGKMPWKYAWDGLHPNSHGYALWKGLIEQYVN